MPREISDDEEDALASNEDDRAETAAPVTTPTIAPSTDGKIRDPIIRAHDDQALRTPDGAREHSLEAVTRPVHSVDDLSPAVREHLKRAKVAQREALARELGDEEPPAEVAPAEAAPAAAAAPVPAPGGSAAPAPVAAPGAPAPVAAPVAGQPAAPAPAAATAPPAAEPAVPSIDPGVLKAWETFNAERARFAAEREEWQKSVGAARRKIDDAVEMLEYDPVTAIRTLAAMRLGTEDAKRVEDLVGEVYDDLTGHRLGIEADDGKKAKREARRSRIELDRYRQEQRADADKRQRETEAERTRAEVDREASTISTWLSGTPKESYPWLHANPEASKLMTDVHREFKKHGRTITNEEAAAFANNHLKEFHTRNFEPVKHLLVPDQRTAPAIAAAPAPTGTTPGQAPTQPATPPSATGKSTRTLTSAAAATPPTKPPPPPQPFDPKEDGNAARLRSLKKWKARRTQDQSQ